MHVYAASLFGVPLSLGSKTLFNITSPFVVSPLFCMASKRKGWVVEEQWKQDGLVIYIDPRDASSPDNCVIQIRSQTNVGTSGAFPLA